MLFIIFAFLAGLLTVGAPCILPLLPILLGSAFGQTNKLRPLFIVAGFVVTFSGLALFLSFLSSRLDIDPTLLRNIGIIFLIIFGLNLLWPKPFELFLMRFGGLNRVSAAAPSPHSDNGSGFILGLTLGVIWTPCAGPILASILTLIALQQKLGQAAILLIAYALGAGIPMLIVAYGGQYISAKIKKIGRFSLLIQKIFGVLIILLALALFNNYEVVIENKLTSLFPATISWESALLNKLKPGALSDPNIHDYGPAPEFSGISTWLNSAPLSLKDLRGKVVLVDFWTYSCINCLRSIPHVSAWYRTYQNRGFVVIGVHTPEFAFEKNTANVQAALQRLGISYPVAQDNAYSTWDNYSNQYWPAEYLINQAGELVYTHFGEGNYDETENAIRSLLSLAPQVSSDQGQNLLGIGSPEMYLGADRLDNLAPEQAPSAAGQNYVLPANLVLNNFALGGQWQFLPKNLTLVSGRGIIRLKFHAAKVYIVAASPQAAKLIISVDGVKQAAVTVQGSQLYTLYNSSDYRDHTMEITVDQADFTAFTFTFG